MNLFVQALVLVVVSIVLSKYSQGCDITAGGFGGGLGLPGQLGFYSLPQINLNVCDVAVTGSIPGYIQLRDGVFDVFTSTLTDNAFSRYYAPNLYPGQSIVLLAETVINSPGTVIGVNWNITKFEQLKGKNILVDSPVSGYILTLRRILSLYNLFYERGDFNLIPLGANRFPALYNGYATINGVNITISATVISPPQGSQLTFDPNFYSPYVRSLGQLSDYVNPLSGLSIQTKPGNLLNTTLRRKIVRLLAAFVLSNRFVINPDNKMYLLNSLRLSNPGASTQYIEFLYDYTYGPNAGLSNQDLRFNIQGLLNTAYIRQQFGGSPYDQVDYGNLVNQTGIIDYGPLNEALPIANAIGSVRVNVTGNLLFPSNCIYPSKDRFFKIDGVLAKLKSKSSGGCASPLRVTFNGCTSNSSYFYPAQCSYNKATDKLTFNGNLYRCEEARYYFTSFTVSEPCGGTYSFTQTTVLYDRRRYGCADISRWYR